MILPLISLCLLGPTVYQVRADAPLSDRELHYGVAEVRRVLRENGLPQDFIPGKTFDPREQDPLTILAAWHDVQPEVAKALKASLSLAIEPRAILHFSGNPKNREVFIDGSNSAFEEVLYTTFRGPSHQHVHWRAVSETRVVVPPNIKQKYLARNGRIDYPQIRTDLADLMNQRFKIPHDAEATRSEGDRIVVASVWMQPHPSSREWIKRSFAWRAMFTATVDRQHDAAPDQHRLLTLESKIVIGRRADGKTPYKEIVATEPLHKAYFVPVGRGPIPMVPPAVLVPETTEGHVAKRNDNQPLAWYDVQTSATSAARDFPWINLVNEMHRVMAETISSTGNAVRNLPDVEAP